MRIFLNSRPILLVSVALCAPLVAAAPSPTPSEIAVQPDFRGQFESYDISSSGRWVFEFKFENGRWSGKAQIANGNWALIEGVKVNGNAIEFYMDTRPISKFKGEMDSKNTVISGVQETGDGRKNSFNNYFSPFKATRI